jgi:ABC-type multidrug transport system fused ATPase/permease subunit
MPRSVTNGATGVLYGRYVRNLSKKTQRALGELTKVSEERLGNVRTAQAFNGEIQEVDRYNKKIRDLFELGKKEVRTFQWVEANDRVSRMPSSSPAMDWRGTPLC